MLIERKALDVESLSISDRLGRMGYGHRRNAQTDTTQKRTIYRFSDGQEVGAMTAAEAAEFVKRVETGSHHE